MRIVSKFRDYYDSIMAHGQDLSTVYLRKEEEITAPDLLAALKSPSRSEWRWAQDETKGAKLPRPYVPDQMAVDHEDVRCLSFGTGYVLFCGKAYRYVFVREEYKNPCYRDGTGAWNKLHYFYDYKELEEFLQSYGKLVKDIYRRKFLTDELEYARKLEAFLSQQGTDEVEDLLVKHRIVTARQIYSHDLHRWYWESNSPLKDCKFFKIKDPYTAFQELDMYISGVLGQQAKEVVNISDKDRIYQHGFDKYSFRKLPEEKGKKQNGN
jgi:hypothetical protein